MMKTNRIFKTLGCALLIGSLSITHVSGIWAMSSSKIEKEKKEAEEKLNSAKDKVSDIEKDKNAASNQVKAMNTDLSNLLTELQILESDIANKKLEVEQAQKDYDAAKNQEDDQYDSMKKRIKYIYEAGETDYLDVLLTSKDMSDLLNKTEYVKEINSYDKKMLDNFKETKLAVADLKNGLEGEQSEMEVMEDEFIRQKKDLEVTIAKKRQEVSDFDVQLSEAQKTASAYAKTLEEQTARLKKAREEEQRKKAQEEARRKAEAAAAAANKPKTNNKGNKTTAASKGPAAKSSGGTANGRAIADYGLQFVGNPYVYGGTSLTNGADCSGFTQSVYRNFGISIPRSSSAQSSWGTPVDYSDIQPGDLVFYAGHVAISIGGGQIVHASSAKTGIKVSSVDYRTILGIRRQ